jgi:hypothetical protein
MDYRGAYRAADSLLLTRNAGVVRATRRHERQIDRPYSLGKRLR